METVNYVMFTLSVGRLDQIRESPMNAANSSGNCVSSLDVERHMLNTGNVRHFSSGEK